MVRKYSIASEETGPPTLAHRRGNLLRCSLGLTFVQIIHRALVDLLKSLKVLSANGRTYGTGGSPGGSFWKREF